MSTVSQKARGKTARVTAAYSALVAGWLLSMLLRPPTLTSIEWTSFAALLIVLLGSAIVAFTPSKVQRLALTAARVLWVLGVVMFIGQVTRVGEADWTEAGPALVLSHTLILSLWASVITSATLVLWRDRAARTRARG